MAYHISSSLYLYTFTYIVTLSTLSTLFWFSMEQAHGSR